MSNKPRETHDVPATPRPESFPLHSPESRAAARAILDARERKPKPMVRMFENGVLKKAYECEGMKEDTNVYVEHIGAEDVERTSPCVTNDQLYIDRTENAAAPTALANHEAEPRSEQATALGGRDCSDECSEREREEAEEAREKRIQDYITSRRVRRSPLRRRRFRWQRFRG